MKTDQPEPLILIVEDSDDDAFFLERTFSRAELPCRREYLTHGGQAVEYLQKLAGAHLSSRPAVILLDLKMPVLTGFEVLRWIGQHQPSEAWDLVVLSGSAQQADVQSARELGASGYLVKPARVDDLKACLVPRIQRWQERFLESSSQCVA